jgi:hypothetical protein
LKNDSTSCFILEARWWAKKTVTVVPLPGLRSTSIRPPMVYKNSFTTGFHEKFELRHTTIKAMNVPKKGKKNLGVNP